MDAWIGLDIGGTKCAAVCALPGETPVIVDKIRFETAECSGWQSVLGALSDAVKTLSARNAAHILGIGISCGGPLNSRRGRILSPPNLPGWDDVPIVDYFKEKFHVPVFLQNDANACAVAEWKFGAGKGCRNMIFLTFGTGLGAGLILDGKLYSGTNDMAGEVGHIRLAQDGPIGYGKHGSFEGFCSGGGIARLAAQMYAQYSGDTVLSADNLTAKSVADAAEQGDAFAKSVYHACGKRLGQGLSVLIDILNPERIVIGSIFARSGHLLRETMQEELEKEALPLAASVCQIVPAELGESIGDYAALGVLVSGLEEIKND